MQQFLNTLKTHVSALDAVRGQPRFGLVVSVDPARHAARISLQPEGVVTGWLPVVSPLVGAGWGIAVPPSPGQQVLVLPQDGDAEHGVVVGGAWSDANPAPVAQVGEIWLVHQSGSFVKLLNDGTVRVQGDLHVAGDVYDRHGSLDRLRSHYNGHVHDDPQGGTVSPPSPADPE